LRKTGIAARGACFTKVDSFTEINILPTQAKIAQIRLVGHSRLERESILFFYSLEEAASQESYPELLFSKLTIISTNFMF
jgi:hypothetical protein